MNQNYTYIDAIDNIVLIEGIVRFDTITLAKGTEEKPKAVRTGGLALTLPALLRVREQLDRVVANMVDQGIIKRQSEAETSSSASADKASPDNNPPSGKASRKR